MLFRSLANIQAQGTQNAFQNAQAQQQFGANLGLQGLQGAASSAAQLGQLAGSQQQADLARMGFQQQTGQQQQAYQQNIINQAIQDYATAQQYPLMQLSAMSSLLRGLPLQSATTQTYQAAPSVTSQLAGLGTAGVGAYGLIHVFLQHCADLEIAFRIGLIPQQLIFVLEPTIFGHHLLDNKMLVLLDADQTAWRFNAIGAVADETAGFTGHAGQQGAVADAICLQISSQLVPGQAFLMSNQFIHLSLACVQGH